ncbi:hypothetical protein B0H16DRAFT_1831471 [Mycena metata]|uniref:Uncharacterized protein n=1 Tax=Mycena metata TaxID=1033252 RepID=A0AAD7J130_9AGAR|nr:hypothetical protein B0H16DRAFT_1831471 [Mycena metata]
MEYLNAGSASVRRRTLASSLYDISTSKSVTGAEGFDLMGYTLPPGTVVSMQAWSTHRDPVARDRDVSASAGCPRAAGSNEDGWRGGCWRATCPSGGAPARRATGEHLYE